MGNYPYLGVISVNSGATRMQVAEFYDRGDNFAANNKCFKTKKKGFKLKSLCFFLLGETLPKIG